MPLAHSQKNNSQGFSLIQHLLFWLKPSKMLATFLFILIHGESALKIKIAYHLVRIWSASEGFTSSEALTLKAIFISLSSLFPLPFSQ